VVPEWGVSDSTGWRIDPLPPRGNLSRKSLTLFFVPGRSIRIEGSPSFGRHVGAVEGFRREEQQYAGNLDDLAMPHSLRDYAGLPSLNMQNLLPIGLFGFRTQITVMAPSRRYSMSS
jgi:hypothetical protein